MRQKDSRGTVNSVDPDQTDVCPNLSGQILRVIMVSS